MNLMLHQEVYEGCSLVGEAVSSYLQERYVLVQTRRKRFALATSLNSVVPENGASYDVLDAGSDDEQSVDLLSDDEELENADNDTVLEPMRKGVLPGRIVSIASVPCPLSDPGRSQMHFCLHRSGKSSGRRAGRRNRRFRAPV